MRKSRLVQVSPTDEICRNDILVLLYAKQLRFGEILSHLVEDDFIRAQGKAEDDGKQKPSKPERFYAKQTVNVNLKHLRDEKKFIDYTKKSAKYGSTRPPYGLTTKGMQEAKKQVLINGLRLLSPSVLNDYILHTKIRVVGKWFREQESGYDMKSMDEVIPIDFEFRGIRHNEKAKKLIQSIEQELLEIGYSTDEIYKLWFLQQGEGIFGVLECFGSKDFFAELPFKFKNQEIDEWKKEYLNKHIQEAFENYDYGMLPHILREDNDDHVREFNEKHSRRK